MDHFLQGKNLWETWPIKLMARLRTDSVYLSVCYMIQ